MIVVTLLTLFCLFGTVPDGRGRQNVYAKPIPVSNLNRGTRFMFTVTLGARASENQNGSLL